MVASRLVQGRASLRPSIGGIAAVVPVAITTAFAALSRASPASTVRSPSSRPRPRISSIPLSDSHGSIPESSRSWITSSRRARTVSGSSSPETISRTPGTRPTSASSSPGRSSAFDGMQA